MVTSVIFFVEGFFAKHAFSNCLSCLNPKISTTTEMITSMVDHIRFAFLNWVSKVAVNNIAPARYKAFLVFIRFVFYTIIVAFRCLKSINNPEDTRE